MRNRHRHEERTWWPTDMVEHICWNRHGGTDMLEHRYGGTQTWWNTDMVEQTWWNTDMVEQT